MCRMFPGIVKLKNCVTTHIPVALDGYNSEQDTVSTADQIQLAMVRVARLYAQ